MIRDTIAKLAESVAILFAFAAFLTFWIVFEPQNHPPARLPAGATARDHFGDANKMVAGPSSTDQIAKLIQDDRP